MPPQVDFSDILQHSQCNFGCHRLIVFEVPLAPSLVVIIIFVFKPMLCCHSHCNYDACSGCMQWQHGNVGDPHPQPHQKFNHHYATPPTFFGVVMARHKFFLLISTPPLDPSPAICHSKVVFKNGASLSYGDS